MADPAHRSRCERHSAAPKLAGEGNASVDVTHILIVKDGADDPIDGILASLSNDPAIRLAIPVPLDAEAGIEVVRRDPSIQVVLIIGREARRRDRGVTCRMRRLGCGVGRRDAVVARHWPRCLDRYSMRKCRTRDTVIGLLPYGNGTDLNRG